MEPCAHWLGTQGTINVTVQTGERLASELVGPFLRSEQDQDGQAQRPLAPLDEGQAVRRVVDRWLDTVALRLSPVVRERLYAEVTAAFREKEQRPDGEDTDPEMGSVSFDLPRLYGDFREMLNREGYFTRYEIPRMAAEVLANHPEHGDDLAVIYYLPRQRRGTGVDAGALQRSPTTCHSIASL